jgi:hypothetical protein
MIVLDYLFYRLCNFYDKKERHGTPVFTAALYLSFLELLFLYSVIVTFQVVTNDSFGIREFLQEYKPYSIYGILLILVLFEVFNYLKYRKKEKQESLKKRFKNHFLNRIIKPWMFLILGAFLFALPILIHYLIK